MRLVSHGGHLASRICPPRRLTNPTGKQQNDATPAATARLRRRRRQSHLRLALEGRWVVNILSSTASSTSNAVGGIEIDLAERMWTIPKKRMKMRRDHKVPLNGAAVALLILRAALACHTGMATFAEAGVSGKGA